jgi:NADPH2:quinone reductase
MRIWRFHEFGDLANLKLEEMPTPDPADGEALIELDYAALNPADGFLVRGVYPNPGTPPFAVGRDGCGTVVKSRGDGAFSEGDRVVILRSEIGVKRDGTFAEFVTVPEESLALLPEDWSPEEGAAGPLVHLTAWQALVDMGEIRPGSVVLISGATGGVGTAALSLARAFGAMTIATSRSEAKRWQLKDLGADLVVDSTDPETMEETIAKEVGRTRVNIVVENLGGPYLQAAVNLTAPGGRIGVVGFLAGRGSELSLGPLLFKRARIEGVAVGAFSATDTQERWTQIVKRLTEIETRPLVDSIHAMPELPAAFAHLAEGPMGKVLLDVKA